MNEQLNLSLDLYDNLIETFNIFIKTKIDRNQNYIDENLNTKDSSNYIKNKKVLNLFEQNDFVNNQKISINDNK